MECTINGQFCVINCGASLTIESAPQQKEVYLKALADQKEIIFNVGELNKIDTAALQLLLIFTQTLAQKNIDWQWQAPTVALILAAELSGMKTLLMLMNEGLDNAH